MNTITPAALWKSKDQYGRTTYQNYAIKGIVVTMPRRTAHVRPEGENYMVNLHDGNSVQFFRTLTRAKQYLVDHAAAR
jgi:hypothetical protein